MLPNLYRNRFGTYYLRATRGGREIKRSLRTKEPAKAKLAAIAFAWGKAMDLSKPFGGLPLGLDAEALRKLEVLLPSGARITDIKTDDDARLAALMLRAVDVGADAGAILDALQPTLGVSAESSLERLVALAQSRSAAVGASKPFSTVAKLYMAEKALDNSVKTREDKSATFAAFQAMHGDQDFNAVSAEQALGWKQRLISQGLSANRINTKLSHLKDLCAWAVDNGLRHTGNPFAASRVSSKAKIKQATASYEPFTKDELDRIFEPMGYAAFMSKPDYKWLPFLALHTGARIEELASLEVGQVRQEDGVWLIAIEKGKNSNSVRKVPLHSAVLASGFLGYREKVESWSRKDVQGRALLFPHLKPGKNGYSKNCGRRFSQWLDKVGITGSRKVFHSFRATFITRMSELNTHPAMLMALVGHYDQSKVDLSAPHFKNYQGAKLVAALQETIERFDLGRPGPR
jgi:integrase